MNDRFVEVIEPMLRQLLEMALVGAYATEDERDRKADLEQEVECLCYEWNETGALARYRASALLCSSLFSTPTGEVMEWFVRGILYRSQE